MKRILSVACLSVVLFVSTARAGDGVLLPGITPPPPPPPTALEIIVVTLLGLLP